MSWKDDYRDDKDDSGLTWDEYHDRRFIHVDELDDMTDAVQALADHVASVEAEYRDLKRELHEVRALMESEEFEP